MIKSDKEEARKCYENSLKTKKGVFMVLERSPISDTSMEVEPLEEAMPAESTPVEASHAEATPAESTPVEASHAEATPKEGAPLEKAHRGSSPMKEASEDTGQMP